MNAIDKEIAESIMYPTPVFNDWNPSNNISQAFQVVKKMKSLGFDFSLFEYSELEPEFHCEFIRKSDQTSFEAEGNTPEMAICLSALMIWRIITK